MSIKKQIEWAINKTSVRGEISPLPCRSVEKVQENYPIPNVNICKT